MHLPFQAMNSRCRSQVPEARLLQAVLRDDGSLSGRIAEWLPRDVIYKLHLRASDFELHGSPPRCVVFTWHLIQMWLQRRPKHMVGLFCHATNMFTRTTDVLLRCYLRDNPERGIIATNEQLRAAQNLIAWYGPDLDAQTLVFIRNVDIRPTVSGMARFMMTGHVNNAETGERVIARLPFAVDVGAMRRGQHHKLFRCTARTAAVRNTYWAWWHGPHTGMPRPWNHPATFPVEFVRIDGFGSEY